MSVITEVVNPADDSVALKAKGVIKRVIIKRINEDGSAKVTQGKNGPIKATHRYSVLLTADGVDEFIAFGEGEVKNLKYENQFQVKVGDAYKDLAPGAEISVYPLKSREYNGKTYYDGKRKDVKILVEAPAGSTNAPAAAPAASSPATGGSVKIYGEILGLNGNIASVMDEKMGAGDVVLSDEQLAQVVVGGRLTAFVVKETGVITGGFKAYGPAGQSNGTSGSKGKGKYDPVGVSTGHAINVLANLKLAGFKGDLLDAGKVAHDVTTKLIKEFSDASGKDEGNSVGNAVKFAATVVSVKGKTIDAAELEAEARKAFQTLSAPLKDFIAGASTAEPQSAPQSAPEPLAASATKSATPPPVEYDPPADFDDDIPFAPIGLQYGISLLHAMP